MTATAKEFCRVYGLNEKSEQLVEDIYNALTNGGGEYREPYEPEYQGEET